MDPNQLPPQSPPPQQPGYTPPAAPHGYPPAQPSQPYAQQPMAQSSAPGSGPQGYPAANPAAAPQPQPAPAVASWYTPPAAAQQAADRPSDAGSYLQAAGVAPPSQSTATAPGQIVNGQYSVDYLDQVAGGSTTGSNSIDKKFIFIGAGVAVALIAAAALLFMKPKSVADNKPVQLYTTLIDTEKSTAKSGKLLKSSQLVSINSSMRTNIINAARDMEEPLAAAGQKPSTLKSAANKKPYHDEKFAAALEDARLNAIYDRVYANEINTKLKYIIAYMEAIKKSSKSKKMNEFIDKNLPSMKTVQKAVDDFQESETGRSL